MDQNKENVKLKSGIRTKTKNIFNDFNILPCKIAFKIQGEHKQNIQCVSNFTFTEVGLKQVLDCEIEGNGEKCNKCDKPKRYPLGDLSTNTISEGKVEGRTEIKTKRLCSVDFKLKIGQKSVDKPTIFGSVKDAVQRRKRSRSTDENKFLKSEGNQSTKKRIYRRSNSVVVRDDYLLSDEDDVLNLGFCSKYVNKEIVADEVFKTGQDVCSVFTKYNKTESTINSGFFKSFFVNGHEISPIQCNTVTDLQSLITEQFSKSMKKPKIKKLYKLNTDESVILDGPDLDSEYLEENLMYFLFMEDKQILELNFLSKYNPDVEKRAKIVNWLIKIQQILRLPQNQFYTSIYILDKVLACIELPTNMYQLVAITAIWIVNKMDNNDCIQASILLPLCGNAYEPRQLHEMERKILKILNFQLYIIEPTVFTNYVLKLLNLDFIDLARQCVYFILDCFALHEDFSSSSFFLMAFAAMNIALGTLHKKQCNFLSNIKIAGEEIPNLEVIESKLKQQLKKVKGATYEYKQVILKYSTKQRGEVCKDFFQEY